MITQTLITAQPAPELPEGPVASDDRLRDGALEWPDTVANPRRVRVH
jgi:hypothetical protein